MFKKILICLSILIPAAVEAEEYHKLDGTPGTIAECKEELEWRIRELTTADEMQKECYRGAEKNYNLVLQEKKKAEISEKLGQWTEAEKRWDNVRHYNNQLKGFIAMYEYWVGQIHAITKRIRYLEKICG